MISVNYPHEITYRKMVNDIIKKPKAEFYEMGNFDENILKEKLELLVNDGMLTQIDKKTFFPTFTLKVIADSIVNIFETICIKENGDIPIA